MSAEIAAHHHHDADSTDVLGFWLYIMTDCLLFATLFAVYIVLHHPHAFGPSLKEHIDLRYVMGETFFLLGSNLTFGLAAIASYKHKTSQVVLWMILTFILGAGFVAMEVHEFVNLVHEGYSWHVSGSASAFFTLVGTHGLHVSFGLLWIATMTIQFMRYGCNKTMLRRMTYLGMFWNFLDIVWIFLFTIVYLMGAM